jgi:hypothetical protein
MPLLRLLLAFALTIAIPLQGFAAASCMCKLRQAHASAAAGASAGQAAATLTHLAAAVSSKHGATSRAANLSNQVGPATLHAGGPSNHGKRHGACPKCSMSCCQAAVSPPGAPAIDIANAHAAEVVFLPSVFASWSEPVPDKPPRS